MKVDTKWIDALTGVRDEPCISIVVPTFRISPGRRQNIEMVKKAVEKARLLIKRLKLGEDVKEMMVSKIEEWSSSIDRLHPLDGVGYFISPSVDRSVLFPFQVSEIVTAGNSFEVRDLIYLRQYIRLFYVLVLGKQSANLLEAIHDGYEEVTDEYFPLKMVEEYEYAGSAVGSSIGYGMKGFENDKGEQIAVRIRSMFKEVDRHLRQYLHGNDTDFVLAGTEELIAEYKGVSDNTSRLAGEITGSFDQEGYDDLCRRAWLAFSDFHSKKLYRLIQKFRETAPALRSEGLRNVWKAAEEGRGLHLLVEKNFSRRGYVKAGRLLPYFHKPAGESVAIPDIVDEIIETVLLKNGEVSFVKDDSLAEWGRIALFHRY
ncbi:MULTISPECIES: hypothetical protein [unclassified Imperialibacter]|uniref:baeRF3 domain-containing protein n=1 Tax=unclassified Imperialibacter TaxID=2629706 RepID=UPI0012593AC7|nr:MULTISPECIES: hypothetical protein [unclassified Imperialibacter]CAD5279815.1 conserved hypothetical protein [Imperialibacter sp. 75]CAD5288431.1 conserved hypothetical protein [Imperialibacter sp. 89]VVT15883.1 conserved hypothetical protein [Imperialibacter sp. EC-SDR9]